MPYSEYSLRGSGWVLSVATGINRWGPLLAVVRLRRTIRKSGRQKLETLLYLLGVVKNATFQGVVKNA